jgi:uncharacterized protein (TIGR02147 family)
MGKKEKIISIYNYIDYRKFISDFFEYLKERDGMTLRLFAKKAGFSAHAFLKQVIEGKKSASIQSAFKIARGFDLNEDETLFLETLIRFDLATELEDKNEIYKKIIKVKPKDELTKIEKDHFNLFSNWYVFAIREMIIMPEFKEDPNENDADDL